MAMNDERAPLRSMPGKRLCTAVGVLAMAVGAAAVASGSETVRQYRWEILWKGAEVVGMALGIVAAMFAALYAASVFYERWPTLSIRLLKATGILLASVMGAVTIVGWARFFGFDSVGGPGLGSIPVGFGCVTLAAGLTILAWCWTPTDDEFEAATPGGSRNGNKAFSAGLAAVFVFALPGLMATFPNGKSPFGDGAHVQAQAADTKAPSTSGR